MGRKVSSLLFLLLPDSQRDGALASLDAHDTLEHLMDVLHGKLTSLLRQLSLAAVVREAVNANLDVQAVGRFVAAGRENVREVRAVFHICIRPLSVQRQHADRPLHPC